MKRLRDLVENWRGWHNMSDGDFYYNGYYADCADELEKILNAIDREYSSSVAGTPDADQGRGTYFPDKKSVEPR